MREEKNVQVLWFVLVYVAVALSVFSAAIFFYRAQLGDLRRDAWDRLLSVADLKVQEIESWRDERLADAEMLKHSTFFALAARAALEGKLDSSLERLLVERSNLYLTLYGYSSVAVVDPEGNVKFGTGGGLPLNDPFDRASIATAMQTGNVFFADFHLHGRDPAPTLGLFVPVSDAEGRPIGAIVLQIDPRAFLYPFIQSWPVPSETAETLLVRRDKDSVLFLNELRHRKGTAMVLKLPLSDVELPAAMAAEGKEGPVEGLDYRGKKVLSALKAVPASPWFLSAKVDEGEVLAPLHSLSLLLFFVVLAVFLGGGVVGILLWRRQKAIRKLEKMAMEEHYHSFSRYANDPILLVDDELRIREVNESACETYGYPRDELLSMRVKDLHFEEDLSGASRLMDRVRDAGSLLFETRHRRKDGAPVPVELSVRVIEVEEKPWFQIVARDITERKRFEKELAMSARRAELQLELAGMRGKTVREVTTFALESCVELTGSHAGFFHFFDEKTGEIKLNTWSEEVMPECSASQDRHYPLEKAGIWADCVRRREPVIVNDYEGAPGKKGCPEGHFPLKNFLSLPVFDDGKIVMICGVGNKEGLYDRKDVNELTIFISGAWSIIKELSAEEELSRARALLEDMGAIAKIGGWEVDLSTRKQTWTKEVYEIYEVDPGLVPTVDYGVSFYAPEAREKIRGLFEGTVESGSPFDTTVPFITARGRRLWVRAIGQAVKEDGKVVRVRGVFQDVTAQKEAENQLEHYAERLEQMVDERTSELEKARAGLYASERLSALGRMGAGIAHQFNTPIGAGMLYTDVLLDRCVGMPEQHVILEKIRCLFEDMKAVVNSMLSLARVRRRGQAAVEPTDVNAAVGRVIDMASMECNAREVGIEMRMAEGLPLIPAGVGDLEQVFLNLVTNAIDSMSPGGKLTVGSSRDGDGVVVRVGDTGSGISPENLEHIFDPFFTTREGGKGTGLGLSIAREMTERYGGRIEVMSEPGGGTTFSVFLPPGGPIEEGQSGSS